jgi:pyrimidine operon attenuation protein / uracil phosphoribosyltransferase
MKTILTNQHIELTIQRLAQQIAENHATLQNTAIIGLQPRGVQVSNRLVKVLEQSYPTIQYGQLDITFYRDDIHKELHVPNHTNIGFSIENKQVVLVDDVLFTGRTIRAALDALLDFGRPAGVELCVLIDRRLSRELPIQPNYVGKTIDSHSSEKVKVLWQEGNNQVVMLSA